MRNALSWESFASAERDDEAGQVLTAGWGANGQLGAGDMMLGPAVSRIRNVGRRGATVTAEGADPHLLRQLDYNNIGERASARLADELYTHSEEQRQYTPPCWEPLFLGGVGFVAQQ